MKTLHVLAGAGIASFLLFLVANIPAGFMMNRVEGAMPGAIQTAGVEGTLWNGRVRAIDMTGWQLRNTRWQISVPALFTGRLAADIETRTAGGEITAGVAVSLTGKLMVSDLQASGPLAPLARQFQLPVTGGRYEATIDTLQLVDNWPTALIAGIKMTAVPLNLMGGAGDATGNFSLTFDEASIPEAGPINGLLADDGGQLEISGNFILTPPNNFDLQSKLSARPGAPAEIAQALNLLGPADPEGRREFKMAGSF